MNNPASEQEQELPTQDSQVESRSDLPYPPGGNLADLNADELLKFLEKWAGRLAPRQEPNTPIPPTPPSRTSIFLFFLKLLPFVCAAGFGVSLFFDFDQTLVLPWRSEAVKLEGMLRMITVTGLVGFGTNWLAIKMLFYPRQKRPLLGQGLIPSRKDQIVMRLGEQISKEIINSKLILEQIQKSGLITKHREKLTGNLREIFKQEEFHYDIRKMAEHYMNHLLRSPDFQSKVKDFVKGIDFENVGMLEGGLLKLYKFVSGDEDVSRRLQEVIENLSFRMDPYEERLKEFLQTIPDQIEEQGNAIENYALSAIIFLIEQVNVRNVIVDNLQRFDEVRLEQLLWRSTSDQLQYIQYLGCFLGLVGGLFIWLPYESIASVTLLGGLVWGLDVLIMRLRQPPEESAETT